MKHTYYNYLREFRSLELTHPSNKNQADFPNLIFHFSLPEKSNSNLASTAVSPSDIKLIASCHPNDQVHNSQSSNCNRSSNKSPPTLSQTRISPPPTQPVTNESNLHEHLKSIKISECPSANIPKISKSSPNAHEHLKPLKFNESPARSLNTISPTPDDQPRKWSCVRCTYENWPKASRCVMCNASPRISPLTASPELERENAAAKCIIDDRHERR